MNLSAMRIGSLVLASCFAGVLVYAWVVAIDTKADGQYRHGLRTLQTLDQTLTSDVLESRSGLVNHYDDLVRHLDAVRAALAVLAEPPQFLSDEGRADLVARVTELSQLFDQAEHWIESFKSEYAVLRNSLRFFPGAARELAEELSSAPEGTVVASELNDFFADVVLVEAFGEQRLLPAVKRRIEFLEGADIPWATDEQRAAMVLLARHARVIVERKPKVDELVNEIVGQPTAAKAVELRTAYAAHHDSAAAVSAWLRQALFLLLLGAVITGAAYIIVRLRRSAAALGVAKGELEQVLESLRIEKEKQAELADLKSRFLSMTSHEFRTPLSVILSSAELLEAYGERWTGDKRRSHLQKVQSAAIDMKQMLDDVLLIGRAEAGMLEFKPRVVDIGGFCQELVESLRLRDGVEHEIVYSNSGELADAAVDERLLLHVLDNLLSNAVKYSPATERVEFDVSRDGDDAVFVVQDHGIGIADEDRARLFETFHRGKNVGTVPGTGLGLAIVKKSLEVHHGSVAVESELAVGTRFTVRVPLTNGEGG